MSARNSLGLLRYARLTRRQLISFALFSAVLNGLITASAGAWLGQTYARYQTRKQSIESLVHLIYERRMRAGMVASSLRRGAELEEVRFRKRAYDEAFVDWNKSIMLNVIAIREVTGEYLLSKLEGHLQDGLVAAMAKVDDCVTKAYDARIKEQNPIPVLEQCRMAELHKFTLDCGATFTNELYKLTKLSFIPFQRVVTEGPEAAERRITSECTPPKLPAAGSPAVPAPTGTPGPPAASPSPQPAPAASSAPASPPAGTAPVQ